MPELPDLTLYREALERRMLDRTLARVRVGNPFLVRTVEPPLAATFGRRVTALERIGKRIVIRTDGGIALVIHLMIAGRLHWRDTGAPLARKHGLAAFDCEHGSLVLTEAGAKRRASLHVVCDERLGDHDPGGIEPLNASAAAFAAVLRRENHTLKRALTDPSLFAGIGNAYSDEILHAAGMSPFALTGSLDDGEIDRLRTALRTTLNGWIERLRRETGDGFPEKVTAFRDGMAVHGRYRQPCPTCATAVQRIVHGEHETNYCPRCQTGGRLLADRALSRLLKSDWPRTIDELERRRAVVQGPGATGTKP